MSKFAAIEETMELAADGAYSTHTELERSDLAGILEEYRRRQMLEHLAGPVISLFVHIVAFAVIFVCVGDEPETKTTPEVQVQITELKVKPLNEKVLEKVVQDKVVEEMVPTVAKPDVTSDSTGSAEGSGDAVGGSTGDFSDGPPSTDDGGPVDFAVLDVKSNGTPLKLSGLYGGRSNSGRKKMLAAGGGTGATEGAVVKALKWLKDHQNDDGSWSKSQPVAMCGLALLTYLSHGETPDSKTYGTTVQKAIQYLCEKMSGSEKQLASSNTYSHGIATYALSEAYGMTKIPAIKEAMEKGLLVIVNGQTPQGGWDYNYHAGGGSAAAGASTEGKVPRWDLSVSGWQMQAMKAGFVAGADVPGLHEAIEKAITLTKNTTFREGKFYYDNGMNRGGDALQGVGTLCLQLLGEDKCAEVGAGVRFISQNSKVVWNAQTGFDSPNAYGWYYQTQAMFHAGGKQWQRWNDMFAPELVRNQKSDGHWEHPNPKEFTSYAEFDPYYHTTLCALMLQVYYRYLPTFKLSRTGEAAANALDLDDEKTGRR